MYTIHNTKNKKQKDNTENYMTDYDEILRVTHNLEKSREKIQVCTMITKKFI